MEVIRLGAGVVVGEGWEGGYVFFRLYIGLFFGSSGVGFIGFVVVFIFR